MNHSVTKTQNQSTTEARRDSWRQPHYEVTPGKEVYELKVYLPGVPKTQAEVTIEKDKLLVVGRRAPVRPENSQVVHVELSIHDYRLQLQLNVNINPEKIEAQTSDGVLTVRLPLAEESKPRSITVE